MRRSPDIATKLVPYYHVRYRARCNLRCFFCYERPHPRLVPDDVFDDLERDLKKARRAGYRVAVFGAAELLLLPGWAEAVATARRLGFEHVLMLSNLLAVNEATLEELALAGVDGITGTVFAADDESARDVSGGRNVFSRQVRAARRIVAHGAFSFSLHLILTRSLASDPCGSALRLRDALAPGRDRMMLSAIEPVSEAVARHPQYVHGLDLDWPSILDCADRNGLRLVVQNIPACLLGRHAHRSLFLRMRVARILAGWPRDPALARFVDRTEALAPRIAPSGPCVGCPRLAVCHRYFDYPVKRRPRRSDERAVVARLLAEEGVPGDPERIVAALRAIESRPMRQEGGTAPRARPHQAAFPSGGSGRDR